MGKEYLSLIMSGVGGQGIIKSGNIIGDAAIKEGKNVILSEVHGMAQRGGSVISEMKIGNSLSPLIKNGEADIILGFEPIEALRVLDKASIDSTIIINNNPIIPLLVSLGKAKYPDLNRHYEEIRKFNKNLIIIDARSLALKAGHIITENIVLLGVLSATPMFPISSNSMIKTVEESFPIAYKDINIKAWTLGYEEGRKIYNNE